MLNIQFAYAPGLNYDDACARRIAWRQAADLAQLDHLEVSIFVRERRLARCKKCDGTTGGDSMDS